MTKSNDIKPPQDASYSNLLIYVKHVNQILKSYYSTVGVLGELVCQMAEAMWWVKLYQKGKGYLIVIKMANCLGDRNDLRLDPSESSLQDFEMAFKS